MKMKKFFLSMSVLVVTLFMSSCLGLGSRNYSESSVVYIDTESGVNYGKTLTGRLITSDKIQEMMPQTFKFFAYSWDEEYGTTSISGTPVDKVVISGDPVDVGSAFLTLAEPPQEEEPDKFVDIDDPYYANNKLYFDDHWLFQYAYEGRKEDAAEVTLYLVEESAQYDDDEVLIEIRLDVVEGPGTGSLTKKTEIVAVDMGPLRAYYEAQSQNKRDLKIRFQFHKKGSTVPVKLGGINMLTIGE